MIQIKYVLDVLKGDQEVPCTGIYRWMFKRIQITVIEKQIVLWCYENGHQMPSFLPVPIIKVAQGISYRQCFMFSVLSCSCFGKLNVNLIRN